MLKLPENHVKTTLGTFFFFFSKFLNQAIFLKILTKIVKKRDFLPKNTFFAFFGTFWSKFSKILPNLKI